MKALLPHVAACSTLCRERVQWVGAAALNWVNRPYLGQPSRPPNDLVGVLDDLVDGVQPPSRLPDVLIRRRRVLLGRCKRREVSVKCRGRVL